jgi:hypothetical protein
MLTEDYFMRMINQALYVLKKIMGLKTTGHYQEAQLEINQLLEMLVGLKADLVKQLDDQSLIDSLTQQGKLDSDRLYVVAELFKEEGDLLALAQKPQAAYHSYLRALNFYLEVTLSGGPETLPAPDPQIATLLEALKAVELPADSLYPLFCYFEEAGRYQEGADTLQRLASDPELEAETRKEQASFYERLLAKSDQELSEGGLAREDVQGWLNEIDAKS